MNRCAWPANNPHNIDYHDNEWGVPLHDDQKHFEFIVLDGFQAGLSWTTIITKRENFRKAFDQFDAKTIVNYNENKIAELLRDAGIVRNELKIRAAITNAEQFLRLQSEFRTFDNYIWQFVGHKTIVNKWKHLKEIPVSTKESDEMSKSLKKAGFKFVGTTICYAYMQAAGMVNDHTIDCHRYREVLKMK